MTYNKSLVSHPVADIFPMLPTDELKQLTDDIRVHGLLEPIQLLDGMILDGRNRYAACKLAGVRPAFIDFDGDDALGFVISKNLHRRHLSESQRAVVAARLANMKRGGDRPSVTDTNFEDANLHLRNEIRQSEAAEMLNVSPRSVASVKAIERDAPELIPQIEQGEITVHGAIVAIHEREEGQNGSGNGRRLPQLNRPSDLEEPQGFDDCQTPPYALGPLLPYLSPEWTIWEPARGDGQLVDALYASGYTEGLVSSSIQDGQNFFHYEPQQWDCMVTNPPYSIKYPWLKRCYELHKPFALLLPVMTLGAAQAQELFARYGVQIIFMSPRVDFKMPNLGYEGNGAQFPTAWFTWQLSLPCDMLFVNIKEAKKAFVDSLELA